MESNTTPKKVRVRKVSGFVLPRLTPEEKAKMDVRQEEWMEKNYTIGYQLGIYIGEYIVARYLPTLSTDGWQSRSVIQVSEEETLELKRLEDIWYVKGNVDKSGAKLEWNELQIYRAMLEDKYLPHVLKCYVHNLRVDETTLVDVKKGIQSSLWDCDMCAYHCSPNDIQITKEDGFTTISLLLDKTVHLQE